MNVYLLEYDHGYDPSEIGGVFSTPELAMLAAGQGVWEAHEHAEGETTWRWWTRSETYGEDGNYHRESDVGGVITEYAIDESLDHQYSHMLSS